MAAPIRFLSGRQQQQKIGVIDSTENSKVLEVVGRAGIGTTIFEPSVELDVRGSISVSGVSTFQSHVHLGDEDELRFGDNNDLKISHNGSASNIRQVGPGPLQIRNEVADQDVVIQTAASVPGSVTQYFRADGSDGGAKLYNYGLLKLETTSIGIDVTGHTETDTLNVSGVSTFNNDVTFVGALYNALWDKNGDKLKFADNAKVTFGAGDDLQIYHDGSNSYIEDTGQGDLYIRGSNIVHLQTISGEDGVKVISNDAVEIYHDNSKKFETTGIGVSVSNGAASTATIAAPANLIIDPAIVGDNTGVVRIKGDLFVDGTTTQINSTTLEIADFVVGIASTATSDLLTDGAGIQIGPDNTFLYEFNGGTNPSLKSSENLNVASGKVYQIDQTERLSADTLSLGTGTTIHSPASNTLTLSTNETERLRITSGGLVGIGSEIPAAKLDVNGTLNVSGNVGIGSTIPNSAKLDVRGTIRHTGVTTMVPGAFDVNSIVGERPLQVNYKLLSTSLRTGFLVKNSFDFRTDNTFNSAFMVLDPYDSSNSTFAFRVAVGATLSDTAWIKTDGDGYFSGNIGIGTSIPSAKLEVYSASSNLLEREIRINASDAPAGANSSGLFRIRGNGNGHGKYLIGYNNNHDAQANQLSLKNSDGDITFFTANDSTPTEKVRITSAGDVGIGSTQPTAKLDVDGTLNVSGVSTFNDDVDFIGVPVGSAQTSIQFHKGDGSNSNLDALRLYESTQIVVGEGVTGGFVMRGNYNSTGASPTFNSFILAGGDNFFIDGGQSTAIKIRTQFARNAIVANSDNGGSGTVELYHSSGGTATKRLETSGVGVTVYGTTESQQLNVSGVSTFVGNGIFNSSVGIGTTNPTAKLTINPLTTLPVDGTESPTNTRQKANGGVSIANSENKIYPSSNFNATLGLYQENEIGGITTYASGNEFIYGSRNVLVKRNDNTQDIYGLRFTGTETRVSWTDQNTAHQIVAEDSVIEYQGADANGRTSNSFTADSIFLRPADGATQTINNVKSSSTVIINPSAGINTVNINSLLGVRPSIPYVLNGNSGTHDVNITDLVVYDTGSDWGTIGSAGTVTVDIDNYYGLRLLAPTDNASDLTFNNNFGVYSGWSESKNYFAGDVGIGTDNPQHKLNVYNETASATGGILVQNITYASNQDRPYLTVGTKDWTGATTNWNTFGFQHRIKSNSEGVPRITVDSSNGELFTIDHDGDVGIGTDNPSNRLDVYNNSTQSNPSSHTPSGATLRIQDNSNSLYFDGNSIIGTGTGTLHVGNASNSDMNLWTNGENRLHIKSTGEVGIGTDDPQAKLDVRGTLGISSTTDTSVRTTITSSAIGLIVNHNDNGPTIFQNQGAERLRIQDDGDIEYKYDDADTDAEVGATQLPHGLRIYNTNNTLGRLAGIHFSHGSAGTANAGIFHETTNTSSNSTTCLGDLVFYTKNNGVSYMSEKLRITSDGHIGIGTTNPDSVVSNTNSSILHVGIITARKIFGDANITGTIDSARNVEINDDTTNSGTHYIHFGNETSGNDQVEVDSNGLVYKDGKVGINTTVPTEKLDVIGTVKATDFNTTSDQNLKTNVRTIENSVEKITEIRGVNFEWKDGNKPSAGVIAQEVEKVLPELIGGEETKTVNYNGLIGLLIEVVKEQQTQINSLNQRLSKLE